MVPSISVLKALFGAKVLQNFAARRSGQLHKPQACLAGSVRQHWVCLASRALALRFTVPCDACLPLFNAI